ncbi:MAG: DSD1 family PLP-dependent enzyme [Verrucomicrobiota bacterium]|jgi:D-serine deaminase-like pyridoxal phosphate-dependent protein
MVITPDKFSAAAEAYRSDVGRARDDLTTPALLLDLPAARKNILTMAAHLKGSPQLRPHVKSHKCVQIAKMQIEAGASGLTTATVWEAAMMARAGIDDLLIANEVVGDEKIQCLAETARMARMTVAVDHVRNAEMISAAARQANSEIGVLIDVDVGMNRCGVRSADAACNLAKKLAALPCLRLRGLMGYEGHCALEANRAVRAEKAGEAMKKLLAVADALEAAGFEIEVVSAGGTGSYDLTGANPRITEIQAGSYVFMDATRLPIAPAFGIALTVLCTVISRTADTAVLDCGKKGIGADFTLPRLKGSGLPARACAEEHLLFDVDGNSPLEVGDRVEVVSGYCPITVNSHEVYHVIEDDLVVDIWPILARGTGCGPFRRFIRGQPNG